jgi:hypothetical protein
MRAQVAPVIALPQMSLPARARGMHAACGQIRQSRELYMEQGP